jgi:uncharacterized membrane protein YkvA (DUF1232 family)
LAKFRVAFDLDEKDASYFRSLYREAKRGAADLDADAVIGEARAVVRRVRASKKTPQFVLDAIGTLADLSDLIQDPEYAAPKKVRDDVLAAVAYFSNPDDLIPDKIPALGFLDDAIMVKIIEEEFKHELWGYRKFRKHRDSSEQRPWSSAGGERLSKRLEADRKAIRADIAKREARETTRKKSGSFLGW